MALSLSIVTPSYNQGPFLERTLRSVLTQDQPANEYIVMDGGSVDDSVAVLRQHEPRVRWISERDRGQAHAVNKGIGATASSVIGWLNSDDCYRPGAFARVQDFLTRHPDVDVVYGAADFIDEHDRPLRPYPTASWKPRRLRRYCYLCQPAVFFRRRVVDRCGLLDESLQYCMDYEYWLRLADHGCRFAYLPVPLAASRLYTTNKTFGCRRKVHQEINDMLARKYGGVPGSWLVNYSCARLFEMGPPWLRHLSPADLKSSGQTGPMMDRRDTKGDHPLTEEETAWLKTMSDC